MLAPSKWDHSSCSPSCPKAKSGSQAPFPGEAAKQEWEQSKISPLWARRQHLSVHLIAAVLEGSSASPSWGHSASFHPNQPLYLLEWFGCHYRQTRVFLKCSQYCLEISDKGNLCPWFSAAGIKGCKTVMGVNSLSMESCFCFVLHWFAKWTCGA